MVDSEALQGGLPPRRLQGTKCVQGKKCVQRRQSCAAKLAEVRANNENRRGANETCSTLHQQVRNA